MATTLLALEQLFSEAIGDYLSFDTTTNIAAATTIVSTTLQNYDGGQDSYFNEQWVYITESGTTNAGIQRQVSAYATATGTLTIRGAALGAETAAVTCRLHRYNRDLKVNALKRAIEQIYPLIYKPVDNQTLVTGNILPNGHFEDWAASTVPDFYTVSNVTAVANTTAGQHWDGLKSAYLAATAADGYLYIDSINYPPLLELSSKTVSFYAMVYPEVTDDAFLTIYTLDNAGSTQTLNSTTSCTAAAWTLLKLEDQLLNDDLTRVQLRFRVHTNVKYAIFDSAVLCGMHLDEYILPADFQDGHLSQVRMQTQGFSDKICYDPLPRYWTEPQQFRIMRNGEYSPPLTYHTLRLSEFPPNYRRLRLVGYKPLETLSTDASTIYLDGEKLNLIIAKAASLFYKSMQGPVSSQDKERYFNEIAMWDNEVMKLSRNQMMVLPSETIWTGD